MNTNTTNLIAEYKRRLAVMEAATPHNVEYQDQTNQDLVWQHTSRPIWNWVDCDYRIKPEPKYRPWTIDEVPVGAVIRDITVKQPGVIGTKYVANGHPYVLITNFVKIELSAATLFKSYEVSYDFGKTWQPCGVLES